MEPFLVQDWMVGIWWAGVNLWLVYAAWKLVATSPSESWTAGRLIRTLVVVLSVAIGSVNLAGFLGLGMRFTPLLLVTGGLLFHGLYLGKRTARATSHRSLPVRNHHNRDWPEWIWIGVWGGAIAYGVGHTIQHGLLKFPLEYDGIAYHIPLIDHWLQCGSLYAPQSANWFLAANNESLGLWMVAPFTGDFWIGLTNFPIALLLGLATYGLTRELGVGSRWAHLITLASLLVHSTLHQLGGAGNDVAVAAYFIASCFLACRFVKIGSAADLILLGCALGLLVGTKYFALGYATALLAGFLITAYRRFLLHNYRRELIGAVIACLATGGVWYLRNLFLTGSPVFPMLSQASSDGLGYPSLWQTTLLGNGDGQLLDLAMTALWNKTGVWHFLALLSAPALLLHLNSTRVKRGKDISLGDGSNRLSSVHLSVPAKKQLLLRAVSVWLVGSFGVLLITPFTVEDQPGTLNHLRMEYTPIRYGLSFLTLLSVGLGVFLWNAVRPLTVKYRQGWPPIACYLLGIAVIGYQGAQRIVQDGIALPSLEVAGLAFFGIVFFLQAGVRARLADNACRYAVGLSCVSVVFVAVMGCWLSHRWHSELDGHFSAYLNSRILTEAISSRDSRRFAVLDSRPYPFFGSFRQHYVWNPRYFSDHASFLKQAKLGGFRLIAIRKTAPYEFYRYGGVLEALLQSALVEPVPDDGGDWTVFQLR